MIEIILALLLGCTIGTFTGIFPGIHINLVSAFLLAGIGYFSGVEGIVLVVFIVAMAITHTFIDFIPSIYLGAPEEDSFLAVLPGHQLLREGKGHEAVVLTLFGSITALPITLIFSFVFVLALSSVYDYFGIIMPFVLIFVSSYLILREEEFLISFVVFLMAGFLGLFTFNLPVKEPLLPLLTGLFGISGIIVSLKSKVIIPKQKIKKMSKIKLERKSIWRNIFTACFAAPLCSFLPGIGSGHAAVIGSEILGKKNDKRSFLFLVGAINTIVMTLSFVTAYTIGRTRTGAAVAVQEILGKISFWNLITIIFVVMIAGILAFFTGVNLSKFFSKYVMTFNYRKISFVVLGILLAVNLVLSNSLGLVVLITGSAIGIFCVMSGTRRINLMGCLLLPTIVFYLFG